MSNLQSLFIAFMSHNLPEQIDSLLALIGRQRNYNLLEKRLAFDSLTFIRCLKMTMSKTYWRLN